MATKGCFVVTKYFLFVFNLIFFFLGGVMLAFGLWILFDKNSFILVLETASVPLRLWSYLLSSLGTFTMVMGFLGCIGALKEVKCMLGIYFTLLVFLLTLQITVGVLIYTQRKMIEKHLSLAVKDLIEKYNETDGKLQNEEESWDFIQFQSCKANVFEWIRENILSIMIVSIGVSLLEIFAMTLSMLLCRNIDPDYDKLIRFQ
ncbi:leukocyte antigen CD37-like isoform X4 [Carcharodon carcharias]|uniref:leukocyte antigen CD37-like isoform X4 n=1 Tax=Carcharodon carcharias TaxID=13397 RepID=UPI001B7F75C6|nr:leukocyte antigen CD37-like isoform X4 [Carcharodon carcharias]